MTITELLSERSAHWSANGLVGQSLFKALANDPAMPALMTSKQVAEIQGVKPVTVRQARFRKIGPPYIKTSATSVRYPRHDFFVWLGKRFTEADS